MPERARELIGNEANQIVVSAASIWEISVKYALGRKRTERHADLGPAGVGSYSPLRLIAHDETLSRYGHDHPGVKPISADWPAPKG